MDGKANNIHPLGIKETTCHFIKYKIDPLKPKGKASDLWISQVALSLRVLITEDVNLRHVISHFNVALVNHLL